MRELNKEQYLRILNDCRRVCKNNGFKKLETINHMRSLRIDAYKARKHSQDMVNFNNRIQNVIIMKLFETPWIDSNLDLDKEIDIINRHQHLALRWAVDLSIFQRTIELCDRAIATEYDRYSNLKEKLDMLIGDGFVMRSTDHLVGDDFITRLLTQGKLEFKNSQEEDKDATN